ncbi:hypothetical protein LCGC14_1772450 [marine sediment metagenome]|uniref:Uncharacterized protein n=1 Tax=marine sediment metagenome TaxID=412755 RepID=A0A0F9JCQ7_9ZZZZ
MAIFKVKDRETIASVSSSTGFTAGKLTDFLQYALIQAVSGDIRFTIDGTTPTSSKGVRLPQDVSLEIWGTEAMSDFLCIDDGGTATVEVIYMER